MTDLRKAAEISIDAMISGDVHKLAVAIVELRQALAQPEREQYVTRVVAMHEDGTYTTEQIPLPKREWVGLTDKELSTLSVSAGIISWSKHDYLADKKQFRELPIDEGMDGDKVCLMQFAQLIEAKLKEKNT